MIIRTHKKNILEYIKGVKTWENRIPVARMIPFNDFVLNRAILNYSNIIIEHWRIFNETKVTSSSILTISTRASNNTSIGKYRQVIYYFKIPLIIESLLFILFSSRYKSLYFKMNVSPLFKFMLTQRVIVSTSQFVF